MDQVSLVPLAIAGVVLGLIILMAVLGLRGVVQRLVGKPMPSPTLPFLDGQKATSGTAGKATLLVQAGGKVVYLSDEARALFGLLGEEPNLERLARRTRPAEVFLGLCAAPGQARFTLHGRVVEGESYLFPQDGTWEVLVVLHPGQTVQTRPGESWPDLYQIAVEGWARELEPTLRVILESTERLTASLPDSVEVVLWDADSRGYIPYHLAEVEPGTTREIRRVERGEVRRSGETQTHGKHYPRAESATEAWGPSPYPSFLRVPLQVGNEQVGMLELGSSAPNAFTPEDQEALKRLASQAAVGLLCALLQQQEKQLSTELATLTKLAELPRKEGQELFASLVERLQELLDVEALGFWLWDATRGSLDAQAPFVGFAADWTSMYHVPVPPGSPAEALLQAGEMIVATDAVHDARLHTLGMDLHAQAADFAQTVLVPLRSSERLLGYLQVADKRDGTPFGPEDLRRLTLVASQATAIIERQRLAQEEWMAAKRSEGLQRIAHLASSMAPPDERLKQMLRELAGLLEAQAIGVLERDASGWRLRQAGQLGLDLATARSVEILLNKAAERKDETPLDMSGLAAAMGMATSMATPLVWGGQQVGLLVAGREEERAFSAMDLRIAETAAVQLAAVFATATGEALADIGVRRQAEGLRLLLAAASDALQEGQELDSGLLRLQDALPYGSVEISIYEADKGLLRPVGGGPLRPWAEQEEAPQGRWRKRLMDSAGQPLGVIEASESGNGESQLLEMLGTLARLVLERARARQMQQSALQAAQDEVQRARQAVREAETSQARLLQKDLEAQQALQALTRRLSWLDAGLDFAARVDRQPDRESVLKLLGQELITHLQLETVLVAEPSTSGPRLSFILGETPPGANPAALLGQFNPLLQVLQAGAGKILAANLDRTTKGAQDEGAGAEWGASPLLQALEASGFVCFAVPVAWGRQAEAAILGVSRRTPDSTTGRWAIESSEAPEIVDLLANQASIALHNLRLVAETERRLQEVHTLLAFSRRLGSLDPTAILNTLVESARELLPAAQVGMVVVPTDAGNLAPQIAVGFSNPARLWELRFPANSLPGQALAANRPLRRAEVDFTHDYPLSPEDLVRYRDATGGRLPVSSMLVPIGGAWGAAQGPARGVLVLDHYGEGAAFNAQDEALIASLAQQTALALDAARLYQAAEGRAAQLEALTEVSAALTARLNRSELIASLLDLARSVVPYDTATLWLRGEGDAAGRYTVRAAQGFEDGEQRVGLSVEAAESRLLGEMTQAGSVRPLVVHDVRTDERFSALVEPRYLSWLGVPLLAKDEVIGVIALEKREAYYYTPEHLQAVVTFAGQAAAALDAARLYEESLARAEDLDRRTQRLALLNRLSTELSASLDATFILQLTLQELLLALNAAGGSAMLFDAAGEVLLQAEAPESTLPSSTLPVVLPDAPIFDHLRATRGVYTAIDLYDEHGEFASPMLAPLQEYLEGRGARALLILPLATGAAGTTDLHGLLWIYQPEPYNFTPEEVELGRTIANQAAIAAQNAALFQETQWLFTETRQRSAELATLFDLGVQLSQVLERDKLIELTFENIQHLLQAESVGLVMIEEGQETLTVQWAKQGKQLSPQILPKNNAGNGELNLARQVLEKGQALLIDNVETIQLPPGVTLGEEIQAWLGVPLVVRGAVIGALIAQSDQPGHFNDSHLRLLGQIGNQLAVALDNARLLATVQTYASELEQRVEERTAQLAREHQRTQTLLGIITELSTSLDMDIVLNRTLALINETVGAEHSMIMLVLPDEATLYLRATLGYPAPTPKGGQPTGLRPDEGLVGWVIVQRQPALIADLWQDERWTERMTRDGGLLEIGLPELVAHHRSAIAVPLMLGEEVLGALLLFHDQPERFSASQLDLVQATAKQISVAINNAQLYTLIRDQAERLGDMLRLQHIETSRSQAILEAVADGVLVTDAQRVITVFNASAERILGLQREQVIGQSLEHFIGLFGKAAQTWIDTIRRWSEDPASIAADEDYSREVQIDLEDPQHDLVRTVSVHLSPVRLRNDFLGTVSTFRDITHQVVVDRMKSEFVATVSHELRTPMTSIKGYVEILLMGAAGKLSEQQTRFLEIVRANTERLAVLVNDLLDISRIEAGRVALSLQPLDARQLAREAMSDLERRNREEGKGMELLLSLPPVLPRILGDAERIHQIFDNLLDNAYSYTPAGGRIEVRLTQVGDEVQIEVQDTGIGIPPEEQPRIFERFYRGEDPLVLATSGTGLGLSIVKYLVEMHGGRIWVKSPVADSVHETTAPPEKSGPGSLFTFTLPVYKLEE